MNEQTIKGTSVSHGVAIGKLYFLKEQQSRFPEFAIDISDVHAEIERYRVAVGNSRRDLERLHEKLESDAKQIIDAHIQMLEDPVLTTDVEDKIRSMLKNSEAAFQVVVEEYAAQFEQIDDPFFQQRLLDVRDVTHRIMTHLREEGAAEEQIPKDAIVCSRQLIPSDTAKASLSDIGAFISEVGGRTSHAALISQARGIPFVAHIDYEGLTLFDGMLAIVDGDSGEIIINPSEQTLKKFKVLQMKQSAKDEILAKDVKLNTLTIDGFPIETNVNVEGIDDIEEALVHHPEGIGLFRTEFLFLGRDIDVVSEEEQYENYAAAVRAAGGVPIVFRVFDIGSDKHLKRNNSLVEPNPALGRRAIRYLLERKDLFRTQLRALLRTSELGPIKILFPFITDVVELREAKQLYFELLEELKIMGSVPIGAMIEVPSAALTCDVIARECDFLSIGSNDLIQYTLATDRLNPRLCETFKPIHPSVLKLIKMANDSARNQHVPVCLCGEMASNPKYIALIIGLGIRSISCAPKALPSVKKAIRDTSYQAAKTLTRNILELETAGDIADILELKR